MKSIKAVLLLAAFTLVLGTASSVFAAGEEATPWTKLERGAVNTTTGWMELGVQPYQEIKEGNQPVADAFLGFGKGILAGLQRTGYGLSDALSFPLEPHDRPVMQPETVFDSK